MGNSKSSKFFKEKNSNPNNPTNSTKENHETKLITPPHEICNERDLTKGYVVEYDYDMLRHQVITTKHRASIMKLGIIEEMEAVRLMNENIDKLFFSGNKSIKTEQESHTFQTKKPSQTLVFAFIRQICSAHIIHIPTELMIIIWMYFHEILYWNLKGNDLKKCLSCKMNEAIYGPEFVIQNMVFQHILYPNGKTRRHSGRCYYGIQMLSKPAHISKIICCLKFYGEKNQFQYCSVVKLSLLKMIGWPQYQMHLEDYENCKKLHFACVVDLLHIYDISSTCIYSKTINISSKCQVKWKLSDETKKIFSMSHLNSTMSVYSKCFDNGCLCLLLKKITGQSIISICLKLLQLPQNIESIKVLCGGLLISDDATQLLQNEGVWISYKKQTVALWNIPLSMMHSHKIEILFKIHTLIGL